MTRRPRGNRLQLGPVVGHTDHQSARVWIRVYDDPANYVLRIRGRGLFPFVSTEEGQLEFGTAIALADGLLPDRRYGYQVLRYGKVVADSSGSFRTMPEPGSMAEITFVVLSCSHHGEIGAWEQLAAFVKENQPRFLLMLGDNVYVDKEPNVWKTHYRSQATDRRQAIAEQYQKNWSRDPVQYVLANTPTYMVWDDHEIRDGWGSFAPDSPTLAERYPRGRKIFEKYNAYFEDTRDVYWHFQMSHNPPFAVNHLVPPATGDPLVESTRPISGTRVAMPFVFQCGRIAVVVTDSRGDRDVWRATSPVLGQTQWDFLADVFATLDTSFDSLVVITTVPIVCMDPDGQTQFLIGRRTDDVEYFKAGDEKSLWDLQDTGEENLVNLGKAAIGGYAASRFGANLDWGIFKVKSIDDARDQWSNHLSLAEQVQLLRAAARAAFANRMPTHTRDLLFIGGDLHSGGLYDIEMSQPDFQTRCFITSGISQRNIPTSKEPHLGTIVDENYEVAPGIHAKLQEFINGYNFGIVQVIPTGTTPEVIPTVAHEGVSAAWGLKAKILLP